MKTKVRFHVIVFLMKKKCRFDINNSAAFRNILIPIVPIVKSIVLLR